MKTAISRLFTRGIVFILLFFTGSSLALSQAQPTVYLPLVIKLATSPEPPSAFDKIDEALAGGQINAETAIKYKTFAVFGDDRSTALKRLP